MALVSMTGFAAREAAIGAYIAAWELRGVNGRGLDLRLRLPDGLGALEAPLRQRLSAALARGSVSLSLRLTRPAGAGFGAPLDPAALDAALRRVAQVEAAAAAQGRPLAPVTAVDVLSLPGAAVEPSEALPSVEALLPEAEALIAAFCAMRREEGAAVARVIALQIDRIAERTEAAAEAAAARGETQRTRLRAAVAELVAEADLDEARLLQEVAALAVKTDVTEEIDRLRAHVAAARALLERGGAVGRKLDFLMQEFNREANTLCSKAQDTALTAIGLDLKLAIDQTREQVQNLE
jgi:uncharacterized protein (TIGR00255 family)